MPILRHVLYPMKKLSDSNNDVSSNMGGRCVYNTHEKRCVDIATGPRTTMEICPAKLFMQFIH